MEAGREASLTDALLDRLRLDEARIAAIAAQVRDIAALPDPVGEVVDGGRLANGLELRRVRVPLGVIGVVYEARPNVTIDAAALCLKSGNAIVLRGSSSAAHSNAVLAGIAAEASGLPEGAVTLLSGGREELAELARQTGIVDLVIPRGGEGLKKALEAVATVPVIYAASGNCHVYVDASADVDARSGSSSTPRPSGPASATPPRPCSSTSTPPRRSCPRPPRRCAPRASSCASTGARARWSAAPTPRRPTRTGTRSTSR
jgi:glutamate-5-semialdehyde dehydrogenase